MVKKEGISEKRFTDNKDGTITDKKLGFMWVKDPSQLGGAFGTPGNPKGMNYADAIKNCKKLKYTGRKGWRAPTIEEYVSIANYTLHYPAIDTKFFVCEPDWYWSSTPHARWSGGAWIVSFVDGDVSSVGKGSGNYVRPVRASQ